MNIVMWIVFGAIVGWLSALFTHTDGTLHGYRNVLIGSVVAVVTGWLMLRIFDQPLQNFDIASLLSAIFAATAVLWAREKISSL